MHCLGMHVSPLYHSLVIIYLFIHIFMFLLFIRFPLSFLPPPFFLFFFNHLFLFLFFLFLGNSSQIHQIYVKSKILKPLKYLPFDSLIENRKFPKFQVHSPHTVQILWLFQGF